MLVTTISQWRSYGGWGGAVRPWRHFYGGGTMGYDVSYKTSKSVLK